jgi:serine O-acetyltransferase
MKLFAQLLEDVRELATMAAPSPSPKNLLKLALTSDGYAIVALDRLRRFARRHHIIGLNHGLRVVQTAYFGIELGNHITLGQGVWFIHPLGIVIGGDARIGARVRFFGNNTVGTAKENGYPVIEDDVWVGAGARILGPITVGARSVIGANAVVVADVPPDSIVTGIPARSRPKK